MLELSDILAAKERISPYVLRTPLLRMPILDAILGCQVYLKPENLQHTGSFKLRGATNRLLLLTPEEKKRGVVASSSGNHAQGVACAASRLGIDAVIVMPTDASAVKLAGVKSFGGKPILEGTLSSERDAMVRQLVRSEGRIEIHPYADHNVAAGQGTIGLEILEDCPTMDMVVCPVGGGGLISGISVAVKQTRPSVRVVGVEPAGAARYGKSRAVGQPIWLETVDTIADGTRTNHAHESNFPLIERYVDKLVTCTDRALKETIALLAAKAKLVVEPSGALAVAAAQSGELLFRPDSKVCFVLSGGNCDFNLFRDVI